MIEILVSHDGITYRYVRTNVDVRWYIRSASRHYNSATGWDWQTLHAIRVPAEVKKTVDKKLKDEAKNS
jgi:hypothetical protein